MSCSGRSFSSDIRRVAISQDGKQLLSASFDGTMRLWDIQTGKEVKRFDGPGNFVESVCFTPDGKKALCSYGPRTTEAVLCYQGRAASRIVAVSPPCRFRG
jgi:WD40 repeat protein